MKYINKEDLISVIQQRLLDESTALSTVSTIEDNTIVADIEDKAIDLAISYISGKYDYTKIFADTPIRNGVLVQIIACIVTYRCVRRNAARKVPEDYMSLYTDSIKQLEKIQSGVMVLVDCPLIAKTDATGAAISPVYGNNTNDNYFL